MEGIQLNSLSLNQLEYAMEEGSEGEKIRISVHSKLTNLLQLFTFVAIQPNLENSYSVATANKSLMPDTKAEIGEQMSAAISNYVNLIDQVAEKYADSLPNLEQLFPGSTKLVIAVI